MKKYLIKTPEGYHDFTLQTDIEVEELKEVLVDGCKIKEIYDEKTKRKTKF